MEVVGHRALAGKGSALASFHPHWSLPLTEPQGVRPRMAVEGTKSSTTGKQRSRFPQRLAMVIPLTPLLFLHPPKGMVFMWALCSRQQVCSRLRGQGSAYRDTSHGALLQAAEVQELGTWSWSRRGCIHQEGADGVADGVSKA